MAFYLLGLTEAKERLGWLWTRLLGHRSKVARRRCNDVWETSSLFFTMVVFCLLFLWHNFYEKRNHFCHLVSLRKVPQNKACRQNDQTTISVSSFVCTSHSFERNQTSSLSSSFSFHDQFSWFCESTQQRWFLCTKQIFRFKIARLLVEGGGPALPRSSCRQLFVLTVEPDASWRKAPRLFVNWCPFVTWSNVKLIKTNLSLFAIWTWRVTNRSQHLLNSLKNNYLRKSSLIKKCIVFHLHSS